MSAARVIESTGASIALVDGKLRVAGLDRLDKATASRVLALAQRHRGSIVAELSTVPADLPAWKALAIFEEEPRGCLNWLGRQKQGQMPNLAKRFATCVQAEARLMSMEESHHGR